MKKVLVGGVLPASEISLGCFRLHTADKARAAALIGAALEEGIDFFDNADIYGGGRCEEMFAEAIGMCPDVREKILIQTKCGIRPGYYDFSREHILESVDGSLRRLKTDYIDVLLLHRPDTLMEPDEVAEAFDRLHRTGKVRYFGVSNFSPLQMELLKKALHQPLLVNQLQFGPMHTGMIDAGIHVNMKDDASFDHDGGILEYCRLHDVTIQPWSPFQYGFFEGVYLNNDKFPELNAAIGRIAAEKRVPDTAVVIAWILRHPAHMQPIAGTTNPQRLHDLCRAEDVSLTREEWYEIYRAAGNTIP